MPVVEGRWDMPPAAWGSGSLTRPIPPSASPTEAFRSQELFAFFSRNLVAFTLSSGSPLLNYRHAKGRLWENFPQGLGSRDCQNNLQDDSQHTTNYEI